MKVSNSVRQTYEELRERNDQLRYKVDELLKGKRQPRWHYESRIKDLESFALKLESGRVKGPDRMEDFFACTLVVENRRAVTSALDLVQDLFKVDHQRPKSLGRTHKRSFEFPFDDLRVYALWKTDPAYPPTGLEDILFEIQIKTFLQHAWTIATHDLVYKTDRLSWPKERIAYQIKAMLEHAEASILGAEELAKLTELQMTDKETERLLEIIDFLERYWESSGLPRDRVRLAQNVDGLMKALVVDLNGLDEALTRESKEGRGHKTLNLSPYSILLQTALRQLPEKVCGYLASKKRRESLFVVAEVEGADLLLSANDDRIISPDSARRRSRLESGGDEST